MSTVKGGDVGGVQQSGSSIRDSRTKSFLESLRPHLVMVGSIEDVGREACEDVIMISLPL